MHRFDLVIRGGTVLDGTGGEPQDADVAITGDRIAEVGRFDGVGAVEIDAKGCLVVPGFVDVHTHYDGQLTWDRSAAPSSWHGTTTVVMGNCGVGFAPCRVADRDTLIRLMEGVEDIPGAALDEGLPWTWESFPEYLDAVDRLPHDVDVAAMLPHGALRVFVMGDRAVRRETATDDDVDAMARLVEESARAGALGLSTSRTVLHRTADGDFTPMLGAAKRELVGLARGLERAGRGVFQMVGDFIDLDEEFSILEDVARLGRPASFSLVENDFVKEQWRRLIQHLDRATAAGLAVRGQVFTRPIGILMGLDASLNPFMCHPTYRNLAALPVAERAAKLRDPELRRQLLAESAVDPHPFLMVFGERWDRYFPMGAGPDYEPKRTESIAARAATEGRDPREVALDALAKDEGQGLLYVPFLNYTEGNLDHVREMMLHDRTIFGLGDGGAHVGTICDSSATTTTLTHWGRDRPEGRLPLPWLIRFLTRSPAEAMGFFDRGLVAPGLRADLNIIDFDALGVDRPKLHRDLPAGGRRFLQSARGYRATVLRGRITYRDGEATGELPGKLLREGGQAAE